MQSGKYLVLANHRGIIIETKPGRACVVIQTEKPTSWWEYVIQNGEKLLDAVNTYTGGDTLDLMFTAITTYNEAEIIRLAHAAWEEAPDDAATAGNDLFAVLSVVLDGSQS